MGFCTQYTLRCQLNLIFSPLEKMPGSQYQVSSARVHHSVYSLTDSSDVGPEDEDAGEQLRLSPLQKLTAAMCKDEGTIKELIIGRRVGFYKVRGEIGCGTFSRVKLAFHALTKGTTSFTLTQRQEVVTVSNRRPFCNLMLIDPNPKYENT